MTTQSTVNLRPRTLVELFDQAIRLYRNNFVNFIGIVAVALVPVQVLSLLLSYLTTPRPITPQELTTSVYVTTLIVPLSISLLTLIFVNGIANAALTSAISSSYLGEKITIGSAFSKIRNSWGRLLGAILLIGLLIVLGGIWTVVPCAGWLSGIGIVLFISVAISPLVAPVVVIEKLSGFKAIRRAWDLVRRRFWWVVGYFALLFLFNLLVIQGPVELIDTLIQRSISTSVASTQLISTSTLELIAGAISSLLLSLIYIPLQSTCATLAYFDLRIRQEGFDLAMMANQTSQAPVDAVELAAQTSTTSSEKILHWKEFVYFIVLSVGFAAIYFIIIFVIFRSQLAYLGY